MPGRKDWPDYLIFAAKYNAEGNYIELVRIYKNNGTAENCSEIQTRSFVLESLKKGHTFSTILRSESGWSKGKEIQIVTVDGAEFLRIDRDKAKGDNLGELPKF